MSISLVMGATALAASPVAAYNCAGEAAVAYEGIVEAYNAYYRQSLAIVTAALGEDHSTLELMVASDAEFTVFHGDVGIGPRASGPVAATEFFESLAPVEFEYREASPGPLALNPCGHIETELVLRDDTNAEVSVLTFKYDRGILSSVTGYAATVTRGSLHVGVVQ